jgi:hypothetical protein
MKTYVAIVMDRSGSMWDIREQAVEGYNQQIRTLKENAKTQDIQVSLLSFNSDVIEHYWLNSVDTCNEACQGDYKPGGNTALLDAMGYTINKLQESTDQSGDVAYLVVVISDGQENSSTHCQPEELFAKITSLQGTNKWTFTFMGCSESYLKQVAKQTGIPVANCAVWSNASQGQARHAYAANAVRMKKYLGCRARGASVSNNFYSDIEACADFTDADDSSVAAQINVINTALPVQPLSSFAPIAETNVNVTSVFSKGQVATWNS